MWWALIEAIAPRAEEMAGEKEIACCVRGHIYKDIWAAAIREVLVCRRSNQLLESFRCKIYLRKVVLYVFHVQKYFFKENKVNWGTCL